jgi:hypothetical protein
VVATVAVMVGGRGGGGGGGHGELVTVGYGHQPILIKYSITDTVRFSIHRLH